ncbi:transposase [Frankia sp. Cj3]|uniref:transposase n=1 Tax=Frankia sp. Cj3 TaxID=2880976 RepID=UPI0035AF8B26
MWSGGDRAVVTAIICVLTSVCAWRHLPPGFGVLSATAHRRFRQWSRAGVWPRLHRTVLDRHGTGRETWTVCGRKGGLSDRAEPGRPRQEGAKIHFLSDGTVFRLSSRSCWPTLRMPTTATDHLPTAG